MCEASELNGVSEVSELGELSEVTEVSECMRRIVCFVPRRCGFWPPWVLHVFDQSSVRF